MQQINKTHHEFFKDNIYILFIKSILKQKL